MDKNQSLQILNRDTLKIIAAAAMLIDHIGWRFYPFINLKAQVFHVLGRITLPIMCLFLTEGYFYTRSKKRYGLRMLLFALLSQLPYTMFQGIHWYNLKFNVMFTLFFCFLGILFYDNIQNIISRWVAVFGCIMATWWCDWGITQCSTPSLYGSSGRIGGRWRPPSPLCRFSISAQIFLQRWGKGVALLPACFHVYICWEFSWHSFLFCFYNGERGVF